MSRYAVIDIGTNSVRLMKARVCGGEIITESKVSNVVRTGEGVHASGKLSEAAIERTAEAVNAYVREAGELPVYCFATSAVRDAKNRDELIKKLDVNVRILSGEEEAECGFYGALPSGKGAIIDVGGGSTEIVSHTEGIMISVDAGCVRGHDLFAANADMEGAVNWAQELFSRCVPEISEYTAIGGTVTSLAAVHHGLAEYDPEIVHGTVLTAERVCELTRALFDGTADISCIQEKRKAVLPYGAAVLTGFIKATGAKRLTVSEQDNLEGFLRRFVLADRI